MRGIEGALKVLEEVERGAFASEALRKTLGDTESAERKLAATIVYLTLRRQGLWRHLLKKYCKRPVESINRDTLLLLVVGIAGVLELKHFKPGVLVNALVQRAKRIKDENGASRDAGLINAVLHTVIERAPDYVEELRASTSLRDQALGFGVPSWVAAEWGREWGMKDAKRLLHLSTMQTYMSLRASPGTDRGEWMRGCGDWNPSASDFLEQSIRLETNPYPPDIPGYREGRVTPQSESSMWAVENLLSHWRGGRLLDMCMGRGIKSGQILTSIEDAVVEGWDVSPSRLRASERELARLGVASRASVACGDALYLRPSSPPSAILLDAPCSSSGTWGRHPDGKWRATPESVRRIAETQKLLFKRACDILPPGGIIMYCTCSVFRDENENAVGSAMALRQDMVELPARARIPSSRRGKPYGTIAWPESPWMDGFYAAIFRKKN
ncbi:MAG: RNA methyltransferase [Synergistaceae bacterium]|jgi:16S rRNA (cytosine967-C5)-methyltransferase|nr:RNA methyltransferase [Synergistaceae bacterium]